MVTDYEKSAEGRKPRSRLFACLAPYYFTLALTTQLVILTLREAEINYASDPSHLSFAIHFLARVSTFNFRRHPGHSHVN